MPLLSFVISSIAAYQIVASQTQVIGPFVRTVDTVQVSPNPIDRFEVYHVHRLDAAVDCDVRPILLAPPLGTGFQFYENPDGTRYEDSFVGYFAQRGYDVWGYSQRVQNLPAGTCEGGEADCSIMANWGLAQLATDAEYVRHRIELVHPGHRPVVGGQSLGGMIGLAAVDARPNEYAGVIGIDSALFSADPTIDAIAESGCESLAGAVAGGVVYDAEEIQALKLFNELAATSPGAPSPLLPGGLTNQQAWVYVLGTPNPGPTAPSPSFVFDAGDAGDGVLTYAAPDFLHRGFAGFVDYLTLAEVRDVDCSLAGDRTFTSNLDAFSGPVFMVANGRGFGSMVEDTAALMTNADVRLHSYAGLGHQDAFYAVNHHELVERPLQQWLEEKAFRSTR